MQISPCRFLADIWQAFRLRQGPVADCWCCPHRLAPAALGDAGYQCVEKRPDNIGKSVTWQVAMKRSKRKALPNNKLERLTEKLEHLKASMRAKVEHPFHVIKNLFRHRKTRYRGLAKTRHSFLPCSPLPIWYWLDGALRSPNPVVRLDCRKTRNIASN